MKGFRAVLLSFLLCFALGATAFAAGAPASVTVSWTLPYQSTTPPTGVGASQSATVSGFVYDSNGTPLPNTQVELYATAPYSSFASSSGGGYAYSDANGANITVYTDANGSYSATYTASGTPQANTLTADAVFNTRTAAEAKATLNIVPAVTSVSPSSGAPGSSITITGQGFTFGDVVSIGTGNSAQSTISPGSTQITATVPTPWSMPNGPVDVTVQTSDGLKSNTTASDLFTYTSASPSTGSGGGPSTPPQGNTGPTAYTYTFSPSPIAAVGTSAPSSAVTVTLTASSNGNPATNAVSYLSFSQASGGGTATVGGTWLTSTPQPFLANSSGQIVITYTTPATLPTSGTDTITVQNAATSPTSTASTSYAFSSTQPAPQPPTQQASPVGSAGGSLASSDGTFQMNVPAGAVPAGGTLTLAEVTTAPAGLPRAMSVASAEYVLSGTAPGEPLVATIRYNSAALGGLDPDRLSVWYQAAASGTWSFLPTTVSASAGTVQAKVGGPGTLVVLVDTQQFADVPTGYWARKNIEALLAAGIVGGFPDGTFRPEDPLTRAQFVKLLDLALGLAGGSAATPFADVPQDAWFAPYVGEAVGAGLVDGTSPTTFDPDGIVNREQMAVLLARALKLSGGADLTFSDAAGVDGWATSGVQAAVSAGYLAGFPDGTFEPQGPTTRAQAAKVLAAAIRHLAP